MNQPVRMGLIFPRSGQQVFVTVNMKLSVPSDPTPYEHESRPSGKIPVTSDMVRHSEEA